MKPTIRCRIGLVMTLIHFCIGQRTYVTVGEDEFTTYSLGLNRQLAADAPRRVYAPVEVMGGLPTVYDWRQFANAPVRNQGGCGSCWAFATLGPIEMLYNNMTGLPVDFSEQQLVSCNQQGFSCRGGGWWAFDDLARDGIYAESCFPYSAIDKSCQSCSPQPVRVKTWGYVDAGEGNPPVEQLKSAIYQYGPVTVAVSVSNDFYAYRSGVFNYNSGGSINHAVTLVGWDETQQAWILRNSWGSSWGMGGYMLIRYGYSQVGDGAAYVVIESSAPIVSPSPISKSPAPSRSRSPRNSPSPFSGPPNDLCPNAIPMTCNSQTIGTSVRATADPISDCLAITSSQLAVWYYIDVAGGLDSLDVSTFGSAYDTQLSVYRGRSCFNNWQCVGRNDDANPSVHTSDVLLSRPAAGRYYVAVHGYGANVGQFILTTSCGGDNHQPDPSPEDQPQPAYPSPAPSASRAPSRSRSRSRSPSPASLPGPSNDMCPNAIALGCDSVVSGDTTNSLPDSIDDCMAAPFDSPRGVWYYVDINDAMDSFEFTTRGSNLDTQISVYGLATDCYAWDGCIAANDNAQQGVRYSTVTLATPALGRYYVVVFGNQATGRFTLRTTCGMPQPAMADTPAPSPYPSPSPRAQPNGNGNEMCANAATLMCGTTVFGGTTGTQALSYVTDCSTSPTNGRARWYKVVVGAGVPVLDITTAGSAYDTQLSIYRLERGTPCSGSDWRCAGKNDDSQPGVQTSRVTITNPRAATYYVAVHGFGSIFGNFRLSATCSGLSSATEMPAEVPAEEQPKDPQPGRRDAAVEAVAPTATLVLFGLGTVAALLVMVKVIAWRSSETPTTIDLELAQLTLPPLPPVELTGMQRSLEELPKPANVC